MKIKTMAWNPFSSQRLAKRESQKRECERGTTSKLMCTENSTGTSLVAQWLRICLSMQGTRVWSLVREDPTCCGATKLMHHNYWACTLKPRGHNYWAHILQLLKPKHLEPVLHNKRSHRKEKPVHRNEE